MIVNATLVRIDSKSGADPLGQVTFTEGSAISIRCFVGAVTNSQRYTLGATIKDASHAASIGIAALGANVIAVGDRLHFVQDDVGGGATEISGEIVKIDNHVLGSLSHRKVFLKTA